MHRQHAINDNDDHMLAGTKRTARRKERYVGGKNRRACWQYGKSSLAGS